MDPQGDIWPHLAGEGEKSVTVDVEIYENWLVPAPEEHVNAPPAPIATGATGAAHNDRPDGGHDGHSHGDDHSHLSRPELEQKAVSDEAAPCIGEQVMRPNKGQSLFSVIQKKARFFAIWSITLLRFVSFAGGKIRRTTGLQSSKTQEVGSRKRGEKVRRPLFPAL